MLAGLLGAALLAVTATGAAGLDTSAPMAASSWFVNMKTFSASAHTGLSCQECHGDMSDAGTPHPSPSNPETLQLDIRRAYDYSRCAKCHKKAHERYQEGEHGRKRQAELAAEEEADRVVTRFAPTCGHCHSSHYQKSHLSRVETGRNMLVTCGACHEEQKRSYLENYHGKAAVNLGDERAAYCTDCHGAHTCASLKSDADAVLTTCRQCHPDAGPGFAQIVIHNSTEATEEKSPEKRAFISRIHLAGSLSFAFVAILLVCFYSHSFLLMLRKIHHKLRKPGE